MITDILNPIKMVERAHVVARIAHAGQVRRYTGEPYIQHPLRVAGSVARLEPNNLDLRAVAVLHDVLEDTSVLHYDLTVLGFSSILPTLDLLNRHNGEAYRKYIERIVSSQDRIAIIVKRADILDNLATLPFGDSLASRYHHALQLLNQGNV